MLPTRFRGEQATIFLLEIEVESLHVFVVCHEVDMAWPRSSEEEESDDDEVREVSAPSSPSSFAREAAITGPFGVVESD